VYASAGEEKIDARRQGSQAFGQPDWRFDLEDNFETYGAGLRAQPIDRLGIDLDYTYAKGSSKTELVGVNGGTFPENESEFSTLTADVTWAMSERIDLALHLALRELRQHRLGDPGRRARHARHRAGARRRPVRLLGQLRGRVGALLLRLAQALVAGVSGCRGRAPHDGARQAAEDEQVRRHQRVPVGEAGHAAGCQ